MPSAAVERAPGDRLAPGNGDRDQEVESAARYHLGEGGADDGARSGIDGGLPDREGQARPCHGADALAGGEAKPATHGRPADAHLDDGAMSDVGVIAGILDDRGHRLALALLMAREREGRGLALGESDRDGIRKAARDEGRAGCLRGGRGAGARRPPVAQGSRRFFQVRHRPDRSLHTHRISIKTVYQTSGNQWIDGQHAYRLGTQFPGLPLR